MDVRAGFEQYTASHLIEDYITKYNTKGGLNSDNWNVSFQSIIKDYTDIVVIVTKLQGLFMQSI